MEDAGWPNFKEEPSDSQLKRLLSTLSDLIFLSKPSFDLSEKRAESGEYSLDLPVRILLEPVILRFKYHFTGQRPTNRLDKVGLIWMEFNQIVVSLSGFSLTF